AEDGIRDRNVTGVQTCALPISSYDNRKAFWGSLHEESLRLFERYPFLSGMFIWQGIDYLGEPTPYEWPARSSYFGVVDLAGFPRSEERRVGKECGSRWWT